MEIEEFLVGLFIIGIIAVVIFGVTAGLFLKVDWTPSSGGEMTDFVYSVEKSGFLWKRYEISFTNEHNIVYCTRDENVATLLKDSLQKKEKVTVRFNDEFVVWDWDCSSNTIITEVNGR